MTQFISESDRWVRVSQNRGVILLRKILLLKFENSGVPEQIMCVVVLGDRWDKYMMGVCTMGVM